MISPTSCSPCRPRNPQFGLSITLMQTDMHDKFTFLPTRYPLQYLASSGHMSKLELLNGQRPVASRQSPDRFEPIKVFIFNNKILIFFVYVLRIYYSREILFFLINPPHISMSVLIIVIKLSGVSGVASKPSDKRRSRLSGS